MHNTAYLFWLFPLHHAHVRKDTRLVFHFILYLYSCQLALLSVLRKNPEKIQIHMAYPRLCNLLKGYSNGLGLLSSPPASINYGGEEGE